MERSVTVYDIARELGISVSTVSRVLNNSVLIGEEKRRLILETADRLGYRKRTIRKQRTRAIVTIRLFLPYRPDATTHLFYDIAELLEGLRDGFGGVRANIVAGLEDELGGLFGHKKLGEIDGIVCAFSSPDEETAREIRSRGIPLVLLNRIASETNYIAYDGAAGMEKLVAAVADRRGDVKPCWIGFEPLTHVSEARRRGVVSGCEKLGIPIGGEDLFLVRSFDELDEAFVSRLCSRRYTGVFCFNDAMAVHLLLVATAMGVRVPEAFSLTGFDRSPVRNLALRKVDTIHLSAARLGFEAGAWLARRAINRTDEEIRLLLSGEYVPGSTI